MGYKKVGGGTYGVYKKQSSVGWIVAIVVILLLIAASGS